MLKWFAYIGLLLIFAPFFLSAKIKKQHFHVNTYKSGTGGTLPGLLADTTKVTKKQEQNDAKKIKEIARTKKQPKPEKIEPKDNAAALKLKPKRQRRPEGLERPPEIPRHNGN
jgi:hypothetical protein